MNQPFGACLLTVQRSLYVGGCISDIDTVETESDDRACSDMGTAPTQTSRTERSADPKITMLHVCRCRALQFVSHLTYTAILCNSWGIVAKLRARGVDHTPQIILQCRNTLS